MAADRPLAERGIVEIKMGKSKFPGKPSKIGNRKRVNLSSCALPEDNDSSKAAKNIYLGLSVFNETFGDNEMVAPGPFHGFSMAEVEIAIAEARLQQREAEIEHKKQGMDINLWESFQNELFSITSCSTENSTSDAKSQDVNDAKVSFDGGGSLKSDSSVESLDDSDDLLSRTAGVESVVLKGKKPVKIFKYKSILNLPVENPNKTVKCNSPRLKLGTMQCSPNSRKSLQSQAAKKLLEKAKMSNLAESNKNNSTEKKFILPTHSIHSLRVIKPNKRFLEENTNKRKLLRSRSVNCASETIVSKKAKIMNSLNESDFKTSSEKKVAEDLKTDSGCEENKKKCRRKEGSSEGKSSDGKCLLESQKNNSQESSTGKIILREARLQLDKCNLSSLEGPFSSPSASSLNLNSQLKVSPIQSVNCAGSIMCGVCGVVKFYRFVEPAKKFGIYCCEFCRNFITKIIETSEMFENVKLQCSEGKGVCGIFPIINSQNVSLGRFLNNCEACWLKLCLKNFNIPVKLKERLAKLLPENMQVTIDSDPNPKAADNITNKFLLGNNIKDFKWLHENSNNVTDLKLMKNEGSDKQSVWTSSSNPVCKIEKSLRNRTLVTENGLKLWQNEKSKAETEDKNRQSIILKGPRVKNVCRSASVALGQPFATFPNESSPTKKQTNESGEDIKNCDNLLTTNDCIESQGIVDKFSKDTTSVDGKQGNNEKKSIGSKPSARSGKDGGQQTAGVKSKKKTNAKAENPVSMDFWEIYDPDEICETGFGLIGSETFSVRALCFLCGSAGQEKLIHCASCCEPYHEFCVGEGQLKLQESKSQEDHWKYDWVCPRCTVCFTCERTSGQQLKCIRCNNSYHTECVDRVGGRLLHSPDRPWVCSVCLRCKSCNGVDVSVFVGNLPLCKVCFVLRQKGNYCPLCQKCYEDDDYECKMMECGECKCWVHAKCEGLSDEKYEVLSFLPESVEYVCRMCCVMPPAPWWLAVEAELRSGYLEVLKALSKNRKACTMLKWSPRKQCTCRQVNFVSKALDFEDSKSVKSTSDSIKNTSEDSSIQGSKVPEQDELVDKGKDDKSRPAATTEKKANAKVINHPTKSLKPTLLKVFRDFEGETEEKEKSQSSEGAGEATLTKNMNDKCRENTSRVNKCLWNEEKMEDSLLNAIDNPDDSQTLHSLFKSNDFGSSSSDLFDKRSLASPLNPPSDSGIGSTDDELKANCLTDEESCKPDDQQSNNSRGPESKSSCDNSVSFFEEKRECFCFLESDSYNSRSKPFTPNLMSIKKKVTTSKYPSLHQFHQDMQRMIGAAQSVELMEFYHQTMKEIFPWFDPKYSRVQGSSQKVSGTVSVESTPVKITPSKSPIVEECRIPKEKLSGQSLDYYYSDYVVEDNRMCLLCKEIGDGPPGETGRLLYCGQNDWVHCNCALWSGEVFEEIDGSLQNVHSAINRGRSIRCPECNLKGASIGCCVRNCQETYHFSCARKVGCTFMDDKTIYCPTHVKESAGKLVQNEKEFEIRRPVYVELDKRKMKIVDSSQIRFAVGSLHVNNLGRFVFKLSDQPEAIIPEQFSCSRLFWSCYEPWRIVRYHFTVRLLEVEHEEGVDLGVNLTIDHSKEPELVQLKLKQLRHFQEYNTYLEIDEGFIEERVKEKRKLSDLFKCDNDSASQKMIDENVKVIPVKRPKKEKVVKRIFDQFDSKEDESCLSDNQNTADLLPPDIEEAIFKDLPNDILDGISMQDIFMDINSVGGKEGISEEPSESDEITEGFLNRSKKNEFGSEGIGQSEFWLDSNGCNRQDIPEETFSNSKSTKDFRKNKSEVLGNQGTKKGTALKSHQKSCSLNWNCKTEGPNNKWKKNSKCHVTVNLIEPQERGNMLQELKFTDGLVTISTGTIDSVKDLKARFEDSKRSIQQEEGKENKCLPWHTRLQPRLLQVDGGIDSSSSGSEAGESPQRLADENINSKIVAPPQSSPFSDSSVYSLYSPSYSGNSSYGLATDNLCPKFSSGNSGYSDSDYRTSETLMNLPQLDGVGDSYSDPSDSEDFWMDAVKFRKRPGHEIPSNSDEKIDSERFRISQCDGGMDSESDDGLSSKCTIADVLPFPLETSLIKDEPVKCKQCHCTYRTKISYQRHLETCCSDYMFSSSEGEMSDEESPKKQLSNNLIKVISESDPVLKRESKEQVKVIKKEEISTAAVTVPSPAPLVKQSSNESPEQNTESPKKVEVKRENVVKRLTPKKSVQDAKNSPAKNPPPVQQILIQQTNPPPPPPPAQPTLIMQDVTSPNIVPTAFIDPNLTVGYIATVNPPTSFGKPILATPNGIISNGFQFTQPPEPQISAGLCINPQNVQASIPGIIIQQPYPAQGTLISSQAAPIIMPNEQLMLGPTGLYDVVQDPRTGGVFLASHNQPVFYNMEAIVSNTLLQTDQYASNFLAASYSQTSTQVFQTGEMEQMVNVPSNYIVVGPNTTPTNKILTSDQLICVQTPQAIIPNQTQIQIPSQSIFNPSFPTPQTFTTQPKIISTPVNTTQCLQPLQVQQLCSPFVLNEITNGSNPEVSRPPAQIVRTQETNLRPAPQNVQLKAKPPPRPPPPPTNKKAVPQIVSNKVPMMVTTSVKLPIKTYEKKTTTPKFKPKTVQPAARALVEYINNFRSDAPDIPVPVISSEPQEVCLQNSITQPPSPPPPPPPPPSPEIKTLQIASISASNKPTSVQSSSSSEDLQMPSIVPKVPPKPFPMTSRESGFSGSQPQSPTPSAKVPENNSSLSDESENSSESSSLEISSFVGSPLPEVEDVLEFKDPETCDLSDSEVSQGSEKETSEASDVNSLSKVLTNVTSPTNSFILDGDVKSCLSMPSLDDICNEEKMEILPTPTKQIKANEEMVLKDNNQNSEVLPLQDNPQVINTDIKMSSKSPQKIVPLALKTLSPASDEKAKCKKKLMSLDQNSLDPTLAKEDSCTGLETEKPMYKKSLYQKIREEKGPKLIFDVRSDDGFKSSANSMIELWANICDSVQEMRAVWRIPHLPVSRRGIEVLGMQNHGLQHCLEQLRGIEQCVKYKCKYFTKEDAQKDEDDDLVIEKENLTGCARTEQFTKRKEYDMFAWLASKHRRLPSLAESSEEIMSSIRRANNLPMAMRYRNLKETAKLYVGVYRSKIHGKGLFCLREIEAGEMVIEYAGEVIRANLSDKREKYYTDKGIGCYMFRIDDRFVVDATMKGNAARFINHSCEPNCYSRVVDILGKKHIVIFALRRINIMEELTYDYKFPFEDEKISCHCLSKKCRKYLN